MRIDLHLIEVTEICTPVAIARAAKVLSLQRVAIPTLSQEKYNS